VSELARIKDLEAENTRLKRMYTDLSLVHCALKDVLKKKGKLCRPAGNGYLYMCKEHKVSIGQSYQAAGILRSYYSYRRIRPLGFGGVIIACGPYDTVGTIRVCTGSIRPCGLISAVGPRSACQRGRSNNCSSQKT
jgi:hypothetical protein